MQLRVTSSEFYIWRIQLARLKIRRRSKDGRQSKSALVVSRGVQMVWSRTNGWWCWGWSGSGCLGARQIRHESWGKGRSWAFLKELWPKGWPELKQTWPVGKNGSAFHVWDSQQWALTYTMPPQKGTQAIIPIKNVKYVHNSMPLSIFQYGQLLSSKHWVKDDVKTVLIISLDIGSHSHFCSQNIELLKF